MPQAAVAARPIAPLIAPQIAPLSAPQSAPLIAPRIDPEQAMLFLRHSLEGRWRLGRRSWDELGRRFTFERHGAPRPVSRREAEALALVARGASNSEVGYVLGIRDTTACSYATSIATHVGVSVIDLVALGPLLELAERR
ncbi:MAG: hypothetical protein K8H88_18955 [Sandaracinaceae bacterium]|nr:hypothetical protein [Sandaracinaceae bacterium]